jgi:hypothetical protein
VAGIFLLAGPALLDGLEANGATGSVTTLSPPTKIKKNKKKGKTKFFHF